MYNIYSCIVGISLKYTSSSARKAVVIGGGGSLRRESLHAPVPAGLPAWTLRLLINSRACFVLNPPFYVLVYLLLVLQVYNKIARQAMGDIKDLQSRVDAGEACPALGEKADSICNQVIHVIPQSIVWCHRRISYRWCFYRWLAASWNEVLLFSAASNVCCNLP